MILTGPQLWTAGASTGCFCALDGGSGRRNAIAALELYEMSKRLRRLEREIGELRGQVEPAQTEPRP